MNYEFILKAAIGLRHLGLFDESERDLLQIPPEALQFGNAQIELLVTRLAQGFYHLAAETGLQVVEREGATRASFLNTSLALTFQGRISDARNVMERLPKFGPYRPNEAYQMACLDSRLENFPDALDWLSLALAGRSAYLTKALIDSDLQPLWHALEHRALSQAECRILRGPAFAKMLELGAPCPQDFELDGNDLKLLPESWRRFFRFVPAQGTYSLYALAAAAFPHESKECDAWFRARAARTMQILERLRKSSGG